MKKIFFLLAISILTLPTCRPALPEEIKLPTKICVRALHHTLPIPGAKVYIKFNLDSFPGYDKPPSFFDQSFVTDSGARGCIESVPEGKHWLIALGYDTIHGYPVYGSLRAEISLSYKPVLDTLIYVSE